MSDGAAAVLKLFRTRTGWIVQRDGSHHALPPGERGVTTRDDLAAWLTERTRSLPPAAPPDPRDLEPPIEDQEIWAAGVTYYRSRTARIEESKAATGGSFYDLVYNADRPELFVKAAAWRAVGSGGTVRFRGDATWSVPEPELALLVSPAGRIVGYTAGNDVSSRDIEGQNPLYLPQAKVYDGACALGPAILVSDAPLPPSTGIHLEIRRGGRVEFSGSTRLGEMKRGLPELVEYLYRETSFPHGCVLLTGTGIVPPDGFTLQEADETHITIDGVGTLFNTVARGRWTHPSGTVPPAREPEGVRK